MRERLLFSLLLALTSCTVLFAQNRQVSGTVTTGDSLGVIVGASVFVKGTSVGAVTNKNGKYIVAIPSSGSTLIYSAVGLQTREEIIGSRNVIDVVLNKKRRTIGRNGNYPRLA